MKESGLPVVWVIGGPGCGKGTQCDNLQTKYGYVHLASGTRAAVVHLNLRAGSTSPVAVCTVSPGLWVNKADTK